MANEPRPVIVEINTVISTKKGVREISHLNRNEITDAIRIFRSKFNEQLESLNTELKNKEQLLSSKKSANENVFSTFDADITGLKNKIAEHNEMLQTTVTNNNNHPITNLDDLNTENKNCDSEIAELKKTVENSIQEEKDVLILSDKIVESIKQCTSEITGLQDKLQSIVKAEYDFSSSVNSHNDELSDLLVVSELMTSSIEKGVIEEFDNYVECIESDKKSLQNVAAVVSDVKKQPTQNNGKPTEQQVKDFNNFIDARALARNGGIKLNPKQTGRRETYKREYAQNGQKTIDKFEDEMVKNTREWKIGGFFDVSSSEVDISEFSMDELAAHVENLTAELRAL